ncbi:MAG: GNAT family protein [Myxococcota bacterium]|nr:GNAT family protein [Myxococcota bacterium]
MDWKPCNPPRLPPTTGAFVAVAPLKEDERDGDELFAAIAGPGNEELWRFIPFGPPETPESLVATLGGARDAGQWQPMILRAAAGGPALGMASYMRLRPEVGSAEVGSIVFSKALQRTAAASEALYLMARHLFEDLGYRRFEWKCDDANAASKRAALRLGFRFEGLFRQDLVVKGKNRDTAWFSMLDGEWPGIRAAFEAWLDPDNFDAGGEQKRALAAMRAESAGGA